MYIGHASIISVTCVEFEKDPAKQIAVALVSSKLDYYNSLFHYMPEKDIARLQRVQNCLTRVVTKAPLFSLSVPILRRLHWLPVKFRILDKKKCAFEHRNAIKILWHSCCQKHTFSCLGYG